MPKPKLSERHRLVLHYLIHADDTAQETSVTYPPSVPAVAWYGNAKHKQGWRTTTDVKRNAHCTAVLLKNMAAKGLIEHEPGPTALDGGTWHITPAGRQAVA